MKTEHIQKQLDFFVRDKSHHAYRKPAEDPHALAAQFAAQGLDDMQRSVGRLRYVLAQETPVVFPSERITLLRTVRTIPEIHTEEEDRKLHETHAPDASRGAAVSAPAALRHVVQRQLPQYPRPH